MEIADEVVWVGDAEERLVETVAELNAYSSGSGDRLQQAVLDSIKRIRNNVKLFPQRNGEERVATLQPAGRVLVYRVERFRDSAGKEKVRLLLDDVRRCY